MKPLMPEKRRGSGVITILFSVPAMIEVALVPSMQKQNPISQIDK
jgi:hypothetical protein